MTTNERITGLRELWAETLGDPDITIALLDGPVDLRHPCFAGAMLSALPTLVSGVPGDGRMTAHGTHIAGSIFGQHGSIVNGIAPLCRGLIIPVYSDDDARSVPQMDLARAINQAVEAGAQVLNISGGELTSNGEADPMLANAVRNCYEQGSLIVAAAGNDSCRCLHVPAAIPTVLAVGAEDEEGQPLASSNYGDAYQFQGILAPGSNMLGAAPGGGLALKTGTSFAAPIVSGVVGLLLSLQRKLGMPSDPHAVREAILASAIPCTGDPRADCLRFLVGRLNIPGARTRIFQNPLFRSAMMPEESISGDGIQPNEPSQATAPAPEGLADLADYTSPVGAGQPFGAEDSPKSQAVQVAPDTSVYRAGGVRVAQAPRLGRSAAIPARGRGEARASSAARPAGVVASDCSCQSSCQKNYLDSPSVGTRPPIFALGVLGYDFGTEARRDTFKSLMPSVDPNGLIPFFPPAPQATYAAPPYSAPAYSAPAYSAPPSATARYFTPPYFPPPYSAPPYSAPPYSAPLYSAPLEPEVIPYPANPYDPRQMVNYLAGYPRPQPPFPSRGGYPKLPPSGFPTEIPNVPAGYPGFEGSPWDAAELIWTLNIELTPIYAIRPAGGFTAEAYQLLVEYLDGQTRDPQDDYYIERVSVPGYLSGDTICLYSGQVLPVLVPNIRGMFGWNVNLLIDVVVQKVRQKYSHLTAEQLKAQKLPPLDEAAQNVENSLRNFLDRIYFDLRNLGQTPAERALNFTATNAFQAAEVFADPASQNMQLDCILTERSPFCRKDSDCWDVKLRFFDPENDRRARLVSRFTVDVSDVYPVLVGPVRTWSESGIPC